MKRRLPVMDYPSRSRLSDGTVSLVERNPEPCGVHLVDEKAIARRDPGDLVELAKEIQTADEFVRATTCSKLQMIAEQVRFLQAQAQRVLEEAKFNSNLHHAACNFQKIPGKMYHLYQRPSGQKYFSMLSPKGLRAKGKTALILYDQIKLQPALKLIFMSAIEELNYVAKVHTIKEWGGQSPHEFLGTYRLENDMSWTPEDQLQKRSDEMAILYKVLSSEQTFEKAGGVQNLSLQN